MMNRLPLAWLAASLLLVACSDDELLRVELDFPNNLIAGEDQTLEVRVFERDEDRAELEDERPARDVNVQVEIDGAEATTLTGRTDENGIFRTEVRAETLDEISGDAPTHVEIRVTAVGDDDTDVAQASAEIWDRGLLARYSNGERLLEAPIDHGFDAECDDTQNNRYQGVCTPLSASPVDWADGDFSVTWNGMYFTGSDADDTVFAGVVDGDVRIEINDQVVVDRMTDGDTYETSVDLPSNTWVPVEMTFQSNGGSNYMQLGRLADDDDDDEDGIVNIPARDLATSRVQNQSLP